MKKDPDINSTDSREEKLQSIFLAAPVGIGMVCNRVILEANNTLCRMTGYSKAEIIGRNASFLYVTDDDYNFVGEEKYRQIQKTGIGTVETRWRRKDGIIIDIILSSTPLDREDFSRGVTFTALDITERKKAEKALAESERKLRIFMENSPEAIFIAGRDGIMRDFNRRVEDITGFSAAELEGKHIKSIHIDEEHSIALEKFNETLERGRVNFEFSLRKKDGGCVPVLLEASLLPDGRVIGYCRDISEVKEYEKQVNDYSKRIKAIADNIPELVYQFNVTGSGKGFTYMSERAADVFGIPTDTPDYLSEYITHIDPGYRERFIASTEESIARKSPWFCEWPFIHKTGETRWYRGRSNPEIRNDEIIYYGVIQDITEEREALNALISSEAKYRGLVELAVDGIMLADHDGIITAANSSSEKILEKKFEEFIGKHISTLFTPENIKKHPLRLDVLQSGRIGISERDIFKKDGTIARIEIHSKMMPDGSYQAIFQDITARRKNELALAESEARYRELVELAVDGIILGSEEGFITGLNSQMEKMTGRTKGELIGLHIKELFTEDSLQKRPLQFDLLKEGKTAINERVLKRNDGIKIIVETHSKMMPDGTFQSIFRDITERKMNEESLAAEKERLAVTLRSIGDGVIATDTKGGILLMNSVAEEMTGWKFSECSGKNIKEVFAVKNELSEEAEPDIIARVIKTADTVELGGDMLLVSRNGNEILVSDSGAPIKGSDGKITGVVIVFRDITEKRKLAESLQRAQKLDSLATLAGGIAHDFNNMLGGMLGYIDLARNYSRKAEDTAEYLDKAMTVFDRAKNLTGQLMTFARGGDPEIKTDDLTPVIQKFALSAIKGSEHSCEFSISPDLWLSDFDSSQIGQVIFNIVTNAKKFMGQGGVIRVTAENVTLNRTDYSRLKPGRYIRVEINDSGKGIPGDVLPYIFDPFFTTKKKGNGLGLSTSYSIILRHGGTLEAESVYGSGSRFWFCLPASSSQDLISSSGYPEHKGAGLVLIMDDEYFIREIISQMLEHMGYKTVQASAGGELMEIFELYKDDPDLKFVMLDLTIPGGMGGRETAAEIRKTGSRVPLFASSGYSGDKVMTAPEAFGFTDSIRKPFTTKELSDLLNHHLGK